MNRRRVDTFTIQTPIMDGAGHVTLVPYVKFSSDGSNFTQQRRSRWRRS
jgi:hypothetical protein